jgi:hypothetical protein
VQPELARDDARDVQQVFDHARLELRVPLDRAQPALARRRIHLALTNEVGPGEDRRERRPELVREHGQELVLRAIRRRELVGQRREVAALARDRSLEHVARALQRDDVVEPHPQLLGTTGFVR